MKKEFFPQPKSSRLRPSKTIPDQSMSLQEIVRRYVRGIAIDIVHREPVYLDQSEYDLERLNRMDFGEKAAMAAELSAQAQDIQQRYEANERAQRAKQAKEAAAVPAPGAQGGAPQGAT